jgi:hypothetical protein
VTFTLAEGWPPTGHRVVEIPFWTPWTSWTPHEIRGEVEVRLMLIRSLTKELVRAVLVLLLLVVVVVVEEKEEEEEEEVLVLL